MKWYQKREIQTVWLIALLIFPFVLWAMPSTSFDEGEVIMCPSRAFFGVECLGCGMTRGVMHMHHAEVEDALYYNLGSPVVYPALIALWIFWVFKASKRTGLWDKIVGNIRPSSNQTE